MYKALISLAIGLFSLTHSVLALEPQYTASPSAISVQVADSSAKAACSDLVVVSGNNTLAPATVMFSVISPNPSAVTKYRFHFGDGVVEDFTTGQAAHTYALGGSYTAFVEIQDTQGLWGSNEGCMETITITAAPLTTSAVGCSEVVVTGDKQSVPITATIKVIGVGNPQEFQVIYADATSQIATGSGVFTKTYAQPGTYQVRGFVQGPEGGWIGGTGLCQQYIYAYNQGTMTTQPKTGVGTGTWIAIGAVLFSGMLLFYLAWTNKRKI